jgi:copper oxidase (laccase) domain-containing protein
MARTIIDLALNNPALDNPRLIHSTTVPMNDAWIFPDWPAPSRVHAAVTTRHGPGISQAPFERFNLGLRSGDDEQAVRSNRSALRQSLDLPADPRWLRQVHGTVAAELGPLPSREEPEADAAVSRVPGTVLAILTADCVPVLFCAEDGNTIGAAHAGWRGLAAGVLEQTIEQMQRASASDAFVATRPAHWQCDLTALATQRLLAAGITRIHGGGFDTRTDERFYSYRREGARSGRFASLIWLAQS